MERQPESAGNTHTHSHSLVLRDNDAHVRAQTCFTSKFTRPSSLTGPILGLWIFAALAGNLFAAYWLLQAFLLHHTSLRSKLTKQLRQFKHSAHSIAAALATSLLRVLPSASTKQGALVCICLLASLAMQTSLSATHTIIMLCLFTTGAQPPPHQQTTNGSPHALVVLTAKNPAADGSVRSPGMCVDSASYPQRMS